MKKLTTKQRQIYEFIQAFSSEHGYPPSVREIGAALGLKSPSTVHFHLKGLEEAGMLVKAEGKTRAITLAGPDQAVAEEEHGLADRIPVVGNVAAGSPILAQECVEDYLTFDTQGLEGEHFALRVPGRVHAVRRHPAGRPGGGPPAAGGRSGEIVVALLEDEATVKTLRRKDGHTWLMPENPDYEPIDGDGCEILGKVVAVVRRY